MVVHLPSARHTATPINTDILDRVTVRVADLSISVTANESVPVPAELESARTLADELLNQGTLGPETAAALLKDYGVLSLDLAFTDNRDITAGIDLNKEEVFTRVVFDLDVHDEVVAAALSLDQWLEKALEIACEG